MESSNIIFVDGKAYLMAKASVFPSSDKYDNKDRFQVYKHSENKSYVIGFMNARSTKHKPCHVYITVDDVIKEYDNVLLYSNDVVKATNWLGKIGYKEINGTKFKNFLTDIEKKIICTTNSNVGFADNVGGFYHSPNIPSDIVVKMITSYAEPVNINVFVELIGGGEEILESGFNDELIITHSNKPYRIKMDKNGYASIRMQKTDYNTDEVTELLIKAISECNSEDGCLVDADPVDTAKWVEKILSYQIEK